ncbi:tyrosine-protein phosphatase [Curtobacterium oceanosedimentum]|uniref:tyrosine-protein phosphatase n=1 Tax=Curtobacterium oceanosedimentum TaxID=465820 RepID=UPI00339A32CD
MSSTAVAAAAVLGAVAFPTAAARADADAQPVLTGQDHAITDVPGLVNGRELGAFTGLDGQRVDSSRLIRSESLDRITAAGAQTLASKYHVDLVIDLRTPTQVAEKPDVAIPGAKDVDISMFGADGNYDDDTAMYHDLVDKGFVDASVRGPMVTAYAQILQLLATHTSGTVLIHCSHGMDRTGTVIDLLDRVLGVGSSDILHDYLLSNTQLGVTWATPALLQGTFESDIATKYAGMGSYLSKTIGVSADEAAALRARFLVSNDASASAITVAGVTVPLDAATTAGGATVGAAVATLESGDVHVTTTNDAARPTVAVQGDTAVITVTAEDGTTTETYRVTVARPTLTLAAHGTLTPGSAVTVEGSGMAPGAVYDVVVHSTPRVLGHVAAAPDGTGRSTVTLPADLAPGAHTLFLADAAGNALSAPLALTVAPAATSASTQQSTAGRATTTAAAVGPSVATGGTVTGGRDDAPWLVLGGLGTIVLGALGGLRLRSRLRTGR